MIKVVFEEKGGNLKGFSASGHAGYAPYGSDIVCAAVTSAVQMTVNGAVEIIKARCKVETLENEIRFSSEEESSGVVAMLEALKLHLEILSEQYEGKIKVEVITGV